MRLLPTRMGAGIVGVAMAMSAIPASAAPYPCFDEAAVQSVRIHDFRVMLMVNALRCREVAPATLRSYGRLMEDRYDEFSKHAKFVETSMIERHGPRQGRAAFDGYETRIGNYHSGVKPTRAMCRDTAAWIDLASRADHAELQTLSKLTTSRAIPVCPASRETLAGDWNERPVERSDDRYATVYNTVPPVSRPATAAPRRVAATEAPRPVLPRERQDLPEMVDGVPTYGVPGTGADTRPEPLEPAVLAAAEPSAPQPAPASQDDRFEQAIAALDAAANALRDLKDGDPPTQ